MISGRPRQCLQDLRHYGRLRTCQCVGPGNFQMVAIFNLPGIRIRLKSAQARRGSAMPAFKLFVKLAAYYVALGVVIYLALRLFPGVKDYMPVGGVEALISQPDANPLEGGARAATASAVGSMSESLFWLSAAIVGALLCSLPVSWTYMSIRTGEEYDQSLISTIMVLPLVVTGIVIIVQNSLALAFALAGIAGAVRFKNSL